MDSDAENGRDEGERQDHVAEGHSIGENHAADREPPEHARRTGPGHPEALEELHRSGGGGKKCHREVECMALGCIPLVAPEVDMDSYANPPIEGVHYLRISSPEDLVNKVKGVKNWLEMSEACKKWYLDNCSIDGMWKLTKNLCNI